MPSRPSTASQPSVVARDTWIAIALIIIAGLITYANSLSVPFLFDDLPNIEKNPSLRQFGSLDTLKPPATAAGTVGRPLVNLSLAFNYALGGTSVRGYHAFNLAVHLLAGLALFGVVRRTLVLPTVANLLWRADLRVGHHPVGPIATGPRGGGPSTFATHSGKTAIPPDVARDATWLACLIATLWLVHPLQTESVVCIIQRTELLVGLCYLFTFYGFLRSLAPGAAGRWQAAALASAFIGTACKEVMATAPVLLWIFDAIFVAGSFRAAWQLRWRLYFGLMASWLLLVALMLSSGQRSGTVGWGLGMTPWEYLLTSSRAIVIYLKLVVWPFPLVLDYGYAADRSLGVVWPQMLLLVALALGTIWAVWRRRVIGFAGAWFFIILGPSSSIVPLTTQTIAEHRMYLPLAALVALAVIGLFRWLGRRGLMTAGVLSILFAIITIARNRDYATPLSIWADTAAKAPTNARAHTNWGNALSRLGRRAEAIPHYHDAIRLDPKYSEAHYNLGLAILQEGRPQESLPHFTEGLRLRPNDPDGHRNYASALALLNRFPDPLTHYEKAAKLEPEHAEGLGFLGWALLINGRAAEAIPHLEKSVRLDPHSFNVRLDFANALAQSGRLDDALQQYQAAASLNANDAAVYYNWGLTLMRLGRAPEAVTRFEQVVRLRPEDAAARDILSRARRDAGLRQ